jgi:secreted trypsin-like serine protease
LGKTVQLSGFGLTEDGRTGRLHFVAEPVVDVTDRTIEVNGFQRSGACTGDSGGPLLASDENGLAALIGILAQGDNRCTGSDRYTRIDIVRDWLASDLEHDNVRPDLDDCTSD